MSLIMKSLEIEGVVAKPLKQIESNCGTVLQMLRNDSSSFKQFGEIYFSEIYPRMINAWKRHKQQAQNLTVPLGNIRLVIYDDRSTSSSCGKIIECKIGRPENYKLIHIPPMLWYGFQEISGKVSIIANCPDKPHDPEEGESKPADSNQIPYQWEA
jgi:dTDP-4-dehydrorhamnose 3,5-epimerase